MPRAASDQTLAYVEDEAGKRPLYYRRALSEKEGRRRLDASLEKLEIRQSSLEKLCDVCGRRTRAWRIVPVMPGESKFSVRGMRGRFLLCCDQERSGCATMLAHTGVPDDAMRFYERMERMGLVLP